MVGTTLNHYRVVRSLGSGGMGEVYLADDTRLKRQVAIKILPPSVAAQPDRHARFEREAQAIAALNHPNIVTVYSVEQAAPSTTTRTTFRNRRRSCPRFRIRSRSPIHNRTTGRRMDDPS